ncbi:MAG: hypothetical protein ABWZ40_13510 [Caulobacterales bacterium]
MISEKYFEKSELAAAVLPAPDDLYLTKVAGVRCQQQILRRASLLAATRRRIALMGHEKITLRMVAADCDTTVQTVFNLVGNKHDVLSKAISDHGDALNRAAKNMHDYPLEILAFIDAMWLGAARSPDYMRQASFGYHSLELEGDTTIRPAGVRFVRRALKGVESNLRDGLDCHSLADALNSTIATAFFDWAMGRVDLPTLRKNVMTRASLTLLGALRTDEGDQLQNWLADFLANRNI